MFLSQIRRCNTSRLSGSVFPSLDFPPVPCYYSDASFAFSETCSQFLFRSAAFLLFSGCFQPLMITTKGCPSFSICGNFPMAIPQPTWVSPEHMQHALFDGGFHCFQGSFVLFELRLCGSSFRKVCSCLNRQAGQQPLALSNIIQPRSGIVCQFCIDNE